MLIKKEGTLMFLILGWEGLLVGWIGKIGRKVS